MVNLITDKLSEKRDHSRKAGKEQEEGSAGRGVTEEGSGLHITAEEQKRGQAYTSEEGSGLHITGKGVIYEKDAPVK